MIGGALVGALGSRRRALVDPIGTVSPRDAGWDLAWWIGADDRWRLPVRETAVRQTLVDGMPVVQTAMRVPGGDAVHRVYGVAEPGAPIVVEIENDSPAPFVVALVAGGARSIAVDDQVVWIDGRPALVAPRAPSRWATSRRGGSTEVMVCSGQARTGPFVPVRDRSARAEGAFLHPVPHRTTLRVALVSGRDDPRLDPRSLPSAADVVGGWKAHLDRGLRATLPEARVADAIDRARAQVLLLGGGPTPSGDDVAALEDWGFDAEAADAWRRLSGRQRRRAAHRALPGSWSEVDGLVADPHAAADLLLRVRSLLAHETDGEVTILADLPESWRGAPIDVRDAPLRAGTVSYAVRWHGAHAALLWEGPPGVTLRAPALDAQWTTSLERGEALLGAAGSSQ